MNNTTPIKILTAAVLLTFGFALTANAALINKGVTEMNHEYTVSDTLSARQQAIPLIAVSMASSQMDKLNAALNQGLDAGLTINEANVDSLFRVAKCINQQRKSRRMLLTAGIVKVISGKSWTPLL